MLTSKEKEQIIRSSGADVTKCMRCGKCSGACPSYDEMEYHPHQFVYFVEKDQIEKLLESPSIYKCLGCSVCSERCPRDVGPSKIVEAVLAMALRRQGENHLKAEDIPGMVEDDTPGQLLVSAFRKYKK